MSLSVGIMRTRYLGDVILLVPLIREIQRFDPQASVTVVVNAGTGYPLEHFPGVRLLNLAGGSRLKRGGSTLALAAALSRSSFDLWIDLTVSDRSRFLTRLVRAPLKGAAGSADDRRKGDPWEIYRPLDLNNGPDHLLAMQGRLLGDMGIPVSGILEKAYFPDPVWTNRARSWIRERGLDQTPLLFLHPGGRHWFKRWPPDRFARLATLWTERTGGSVVVAGSGAERTLVDSVINGVADSRIFPLAGAPLGLLDGLIRWSRAFVGSDSGPLHMADAAHVPLVGLFGSTLPEVWGPTSSLHRQVLFHRLPCSPCRHTGCPEGEGNCLSRISVDEVFEKVEGFL